MNFLENNTLKIGVKDKGAELCSLINKKDNTELLWQGDEKTWMRQSPILFPNVGKQKNMGFIYKGEFYPSNQHGFARDNNFELELKAKNALVYSFSSNQETKKIYPFDFKLSVIYKISPFSLKISFNVVNTGKEPMYFTLGAHPGFNTKSDSYLCFPGLNILKVKMLNTETGLVRKEEKNLALENQRLYLKPDLFKDDAFIVDNQIKEVILVNDNKPTIQLLSPDFPNFGLWNKPGADFVCLEPWLGRADDEDFNGEISTKPGITALNSGQELNKFYQINIF